MKTQAGAGTRGLMLDPVFSVMVGGHRQARLDRHWDAGSDRDLRRAALVQMLEDMLARLRTRAAAAFLRGGAVYRDDPPTFRMVTGQASGVDRLAIAAATVTGYDLHVVLPHDADTCPDCDWRGLDEITRGVALGMPPLDGAGQVDERAFVLRDSLASRFSDVLVAVWDGQEPDGALASGTGIMIREALLRRQPVILLSLDVQCDSPRLLIADPDSLTDARLMEMQVLDPDAELLMTLFVAPEASEIDSMLDRWLSIVLCPFEPALDSENEENRLLARIRAQRSVSGYLLHWLVFLFGWMTGDRQRPRPLGLASWLGGSWLWLRVMLDPPRRSQALRVLEILGREVTKDHWQERLVHRFHGFFSNLARLAPGKALAALRSSRPVNRYEDIRPAPARRAEHPIEEPGYEQAFNWADALAARYGRRYRDDTWVIYYAAAFAVFCAVAGAIHLWPAAAEGIPTFWIFLEFILLHFIVRRVLKARFRDDHGHWISYRFIAEQLRYLRFGYPLLVLPHTLSRPDWRPEKTADGESRQSLQSAELWILRRLLIAEGLPRARGEQRVYRMTRHNEVVLDYVNDVLREHQQYFRRSFRNLHRDHQYLHRLAFALFTLTFLAVTLHFFFYLSWILIFTAFFPAWGAAIHGILTQNEVVRVSAMAGRVWQQLTDLREAFRLHQVLRARETRSVSPRWRRTQDLRELVQASSDILSDENRYWRSLLQHNETNLPG